MRTFLPFLAFGFLLPASAAPTPDPLMDLKDNEWYLEHLPGPEPMNNLDIRRMRVWATTKFELVLQTMFRMPEASQFDPKTKRHYCDIVFVVSLTLTDGAKGTYDIEQRLRLGGYFGNMCVFRDEWKARRNADGEVDMRGEVEVTIQPGKYDFKTPITVGKLSGTQVRIIVTKPK